VATITIEGNRLAVSFEVFFREVEPKLRRALVAKHGAIRGREATAEALSWAWEHQDQLSAIRNPIGYLYRVGSTRTRPKPRLIPFLREREESLAYEPQLGLLLLGLPQQQRVATVLIHGYGYTLIETASLMGIKPTTVQNHASRGLEKLRRGLGVSIDE
jgi:DNA-directed RNA polymerase specialized sigma24 family protein